MPLTDIWLGNGGPTVRFLWILAITLLAYRKTILIFIYRHEEWRMFCFELSFRHHKLNDLLQKAFRQAGLKMLDVHSIRWTTPQGHWVESQRFHQLQAMMGADFTALQAYVSEAHGSIHQFKSNAPQAAQFEYINLLELSNMEFQFHGIIWFNQIWLILCESWRRAQLERLQTILRRIDALLDIDPEFDERSRAACDRYKYLQRLHKHLQRDWRCKDCEHAFSAFLEVERVVNPLQAKIHFTFDDERHTRVVSFSIDPKVEENSAGTHTAPSSAQASCGTKTTKKRSFLPKWWSNEEAYVSADDQAIIENIELSTRRVEYSLPNTTICQILSESDGDHTYGLRYSPEVICTITTGESKKRAPVTLQRYLEEYKPDIDWRMKLAATAATCFLSTAGGNWLQLEKWESSGDLIYMFDVEDRGLADSLYVRSHLEPNERHFAPLKYTTEQVRTMLLVLGIILLELIHGKPLSRCPYLRKKKAPADSNDIKLGAELWARSLDTADMAQSEQVADAIRKCIFARFDELPTGTKDLQREYKFRFEFLNSVVAVFDRSISTDREPNKHAPRLIGPRWTRHRKLRHADEDD